MSPSELPRGVTQLAEQYDLPGCSTRQLSQLLRILSEDLDAPTTIRDSDHVLRDHLADSLVAIELDPVRMARSVVDLGSGAGLPGLPLAIALPHSRFVLVEAVGRKCAFIERAASACSLTNVEVRHARAEALTATPERFGLAVVRAVAPLDVVLEYAAPLLQPDGQLVVWRGNRDVEVEEAGGRAADLLGFEVGEIRRVKPYPSAHDRHLHLFLKVRKTPNRFPRRPGIAAKRPLGSA